MKSKSLTEYECDQIEQIIGFRITSSMKDPDGKYFGFLCKKGRQVKNVWVNCDPEGNGPGHLNIEGPELGCWLAVSLVESLDRLL